MELTEQTLRVRLNALLENKTQRQLAKELNISPAYLNDILHGRRNVSSPKILKKFGLKKRLTFR